MRFIAEILIFLVIFMATCTLVSGFAVFLLVKGMKKIVNYLKRRKVNAQKI